MKIEINQLKLSTILAMLEAYVNNVVSLFVKLSNTSIFTKDIQIKLSKIDEDMKASAHQLSLDPSCSFAHFTKIKYLTDVQEKLSRKEAKIRATLAKFQGRSLPNMDKT